MNTTFGLGNVVATGFRIWARNLLAFLLLTVLIYSPLVLWGILVVHGELDRGHQLETFLLVSFWLVQLLSILASAALTYGVVMELQGQRPSFGACVAMGFRRFLPALGTTMVLALCVGGACIFPFMIVVASPIVGLIVLAIVYLWVFSILFVAVQATIIEQPGVVSALGRAADLTKDHRFAIIGLMIFLAVLGFGVEYAIRMLANSAAVYVYLHLIQQIVFASLGGVMSGVAYYQLRSEKEGTSAEELARIFD